MAARILIEPPHPNGLPGPLRYPTREPRWDGEPSQPGGQSMAIFPCDISSHRYPGPQQTLYVSLVNNGMVSRRKMRLCPKHFEGELEVLQDRAQLVDMNDTSEEQAFCFECLKDLLKPEAHVFLTVFRAHSARADWWAPVHEACMGMLQGRYGLGPLSQ